MEFNKPINCHVALSKMERERLVIKIQKASAKQQKQNWYCDEKLPQHTYTHRGSLNFSLMGSQIAVRPWTATL